MMYAEHGDARKKPRAVFGNSVFNDTRDPGLTVSKNYGLKRIVRSGSVSTAIYRQRLANLLHA